VQGSEVLSFAPYRGEPISLSTVYIFEVGEIEKRSHRAPLMTAFDEAV
jgi:hypothetical protein